MLESGDLSQILKELERDEKSFQEDLEILRNWLKTQAHLPELMDDKRISAFLMMNKCRIENTKEKIDMYYTIRSLWPEIYNESDPNSPLVQEAAKMAYIVAMPKITKDYARVTIFKMRDPSLVDKMDPLLIFKHCINLVDLRLLTDNVFKDIFIFDMEHFSFTYLTKCIPVLPKMVKYWEKVWSIRFKGYYIINSAPILTTILNVLKPLVKPKIFSRIHVLDSPKKINELFPKELLPKDYGGEERSLEELFVLVQAEFKRYEKYFKERNSLRVDEKLRVKLVNNETMGFYGNFKALNVD